MQLSSGRQNGWQSYGQLQWRGYAFWQDQVVDPATLIDHLSSFNRPQDWSNWLNELNGCFALVWQADDLLVAAVDIGRTIPLFWNNEADTILLSDSLNNKPIAGDSFWLQENWFAHAEFIPGSACMYDDWQQLLAGQFLYQQEGATKIHSYFTHHRLQPLDQPYDELSNQFSEVLDQIIDRLIKWANGRPIVIPLSGGYDSRLILAGLKQQAYPAIKTFTYGQPGSWEVKVASGMAERLEVDWAFVHYTPALLNEFFKEDWQQFASYAANGVSLPQEQDYFALLELKRRGWLAAGSIICPGYCGDFQAGSYHPQGYYRFPWRGQKALVDQVVHRFLTKPGPEVKKALVNELPQLPATDEDAIISELEHWVLSEYVSKYILNGVRAYEWMDCQWYLPLWDRSFIDFWRQVPNQHRTEMQLYRATLEQKWFRDMDLCFSEDQQPFKKRWIDIWLPINWKQALKQLRPSSPVSNLNGLHALIPLIQAQLEWPEKDLTRPVNEMIGWWHMQQIEKSRYL